MMLSFQKLGRSAFTPKMATVAASFSTQTEAAVTAALNKARWSDCRDEVSEISKLMREGTTNHSISLPSATLQHQVDDRLRALQPLVANKQHHEAFHQLHSLKALVKNELYHRSNRQQMMSFSSVAYQQVDDFDEEDLHEMHQSLDNLAKSTVSHDLTATEQVRAFQAEMDTLRWSDVKNEAQEILNLMREGTTNHAVALPGDELSQTITDGLHDVGSLIHQHSSTAEAHAEAFKKVHQLKSFLKAELYK